MEWWSGGAGFGPRIGDGWPIFAISRHKTYFFGLIWLNLP
jgi:hypothetical protein